MKFEEIVKGVWTIEPEVHADKRGNVFEVFRADELEAHGLNAGFAYDYTGMIESGTINIGDCGCLVFLAEGTAIVHVNGIEIECSGNNKKQVYCENGLDCSLEILSSSYVILKSRKELSQ